MTTQPTDQDLLIANLETQLYLNLLYAGAKAKDVDSSVLNSKLSKEEGLLMGAFVAMGQTVAALMTAKGKK